MLWRIRENEQGPSKKQDRAASRLLSAHANVHYPLKSGCNSVRLCFAQILKPRATVNCTLFSRARPLNRKGERERERGRDYIALGDQG